jgi:L-lactate dehydrogenase complex protein LldF
MKLFDGDVKWHDESLTFVRQKRDLASKTLPEWESLRSIASNIKTHTITHLDEYLLEFEKNALQNGIKVHWANDGDEHNKIIKKILKSKNAKKILKSKSMLTEECGLNHYLEKDGYEIIDSDLGERIVQLNKEPPSHIVLPAIHLKKEQVAEIFDEDDCDPDFLTSKARESLREHFISCDVAITGVNFAIASEGAFVVCTNEGNADLATSLCDTHIACMGIEKMIPKLDDLAIFTRMLARSATGQAITTYTSHFKKPSPNKEIHIIIVDNGRSDMLKDENFMQSLKCIRCGACMNSCPIFKKAGGHNYSYTIPGPIGSNLGANKDIKKHGKMVFASTLCGSCTAVCPVEINLHEQLLAYRSEYKKVVFEDKDKIYKAIFYLFKHPKTLRVLTKFASLLPHTFYKNRWGKDRVAPKLAKKSFKDLYEQQR